MSNLGPVPTCSEQGGPVRDREVLPHGENKHAKNGVVSERDPCVNGVLETGVRGKVGLCTRCGAGQWSHSLGKRQCVSIWHCGGGTRCRSSEQTRRKQRNVGEELSHITDHRKRRSEKKSREFTYFSITRACPLSLYTLRTSASPKASSRTPRIPEVQ